MKKIGSADPKPLEAAARRPDRRARRSAETRERIMRSALSLFARQGYVSTTIEDITDAADVGKGTFFNYFPSKEHIFLAQARVRADRTLRNFEEIRDSDGPVEKAVHRLVMTYIDEDRISPMMYRNIMAAICSNDDVRILMAQGIELARKPLAELMMLGQERGEVRDDLTPMELAREIQRIFSGTMLLWAFSTVERPWPECRKEILNAVWSGIRAPAGPKKKRSQGR